MEKERTAAADDGDDAVSFVIVDWHNVVEEVVVGRRGRSRL